MNTADKIVNTPGSAGTTPAALRRTWPVSSQAAAGLIVATVLGGIAWASRHLHEAPSGPVINSAPVDYAVDLNTADHAELLQLPGVGDSLASKIESYRAEHGSFNSVEDLRRVPGVGPATLARLTPWVTVENSKAERAGTALATTTVRPEQRQATSPKKPAITQQIDINRADIAELKQLPGIGQKLAERIVRERARGPFQSIDDLRRVAGIGPKTLERLRPHIIVTSAAGATASTASP